MHLRVGRLATAVHRNESFCLIAVDARLIVFCAVQTVAVRARDDSVVVVYAESRNYLFELDAAVVLPVVVGLAVGALGIVGLT